LSRAAYAATLYLVHLMRGVRIRKQASLEIQIGDSITLTPAVNRRNIGTRFPDRPCGLSFPDRAVSLKINEKFCRLEFQGAREATRQEVAEASFKKRVRNFALMSTLPCTTAHLSADSDIGQQRHLERTAAMTGDKLGEVSCQ
jgi:hypothetical protein